MKKVFSFAVALLLSAAMFATDWAGIAFLGDGAGGGTYTDKYKMAVPEGVTVVNIQQPGFATEAGIYVTFPVAVSECSLSGSAIQGAGIVIYLSNFTAQETAFTVTDANSAVYNCEVYYADGTPEEVIPEGPAINPYAYAVSTVDNEDGTITVNYSLNTNANSVELVTYKDGAEAATQALADKYIGAHTATVALPTEPGNYTFGIRVNGTSPEAPTKLAKTYSFWSPYGMAIDKNPASANFGRLLICEADSRVAAKPAYHAGGKGAGIYAFNPDFTPVADGAVFNGGLTPIEFISGSTRAFAPHQVVISEDGRIFATMISGDYCPVYELSADLQTWTHFFHGTYREDGLMYNADSTFLAGKACSIDTKGSGENLKLLIYSCSLNGAVSNSQAGYRLDEYALGTATTFSGTPTHIEALDGAYGLVHNYVGVHYDRINEGGLWFTANRGGNAGQPNLAHWNAAGVRDYYSESSNYYGGAGIGQKDGKIYMGGNSGFIQAYTATPGETEMTIATTGTQITTENGRAVNAVEFDYAGNMYSCSNSGEKLIVFAMPYSGSVETPLQGEWQVGPVEQMIANPLGEDGRFIVKYDCETGEWAEANPEIGETFTFAVDVTGSWLEEWVNASDIRGIAFNKWSSRDGFDGDAV
ncbi:MAG: hypothetical protein KBS77_02335, partial [Bacteroidales bacterium]|nr:hypothetical protein [Candidatus Colicola faecequi]